MNHKVYFRSLYRFLLSLIVFFFLNHTLNYLLINQTKVIVELATSNKDMYQLFYDTGSGFNEKESIRKQVNASNDLQEIEFLLPVENVQNLRFDLGTIPNTLISVKNIYLENYFRLNILNKFTMSNEVMKIPNAGLFQIKTSGNDPFITTGNVVVTFNKLSKLFSYLKYIIALFIAVLFFILLHVVNYNHLLIAKLNRNNLLIAMLIIILLMPLSAMALGYKNSNTENRQLAKAPQLSRETLFSFSKEFETYFNDNIGFRDILIHWNTLINVNLFKVSPNPLVVVGKNNWLYYTGDHPTESMDDYEGLVRFTPEELKRIGNNLEEKKKQMESLGITFIFCVAPDKQTIYPEYLPSDIRKISNETRLDQLEYYLNKNTDIKVLDLRKTLTENKSAHQLYYATDTHWNEYGAFLGYQAIMKEINNSYSNLKPHDVSDYRIISQDKYGDLAKMLTLKIHDQKVSFIPKFTSNVHDTKVNNSLYPDPQKIVVKENANRNLPKLLMFRDSFTDPMLPFLSQHFSKSTYIWDYNLNEKVIKRESPNIVVLEIVQRNLSSLER